MTVEEKWLVTFGLIAMVFLVHYVVYRWDKSIKQQLARRERERKAYGRNPDSLSSHDRDPRRGL